MCFCKCCLWCLEKCIRYISKNAYILTAMFGYNFCKSSCKESRFKFTNDLFYDNVKLITICKGDQINCRQCGQGGSIGRDNRFYVVYWKAICSLGFRGFDMGIFQRHVSGKQNHSCKEITQDKCKLDLVCCCP